MLNVCGYDFTVYMCTKENVNGGGNTSTIHKTEYLFYILRYGSPTEEVKDKEDKIRSYQ